MSENLFYSIIIIMHVTCILEYVVLMNSDTKDTQIFEHV
jgi:hypothetical protein